MSKLPMDLSKFSKMKGDKHTTTFQHKDGHLITIAHSKLSEKLRKEIAKIPNGKVQRFEDGGGVQAESAEDTPEQIEAAAAQAAPMTPGELAYNQIHDQIRQNNPGQPEQATQQMALDAALRGQTNQKWSAERADDSAKAAQQDKLNRASDENTKRAKLGMAPLPNEAQPTEQPTDDNVDTTTAAPEAPQPTQPQAPQQPAQQAAPKAPTLEQMSQQKTQELQQHLSAWQQDLTNGHVQAKTYSDLFHDKSTPSKISTLFGLLIGGAGAGLLHQENPVMQMMSNQIENDFKSQVQSKDNAMNYIRLAQSSLMNQANISHMNQETATAGYGLARMMANTALMHSLVQKTQTLPPGSPRRQQAEQTLGMLANSMNDQNSMLADKAGAMSAYYKMLGMGPQEGQSQGTEQGFQQQMNAMRMTGPQGAERAKMLESRHIPGVPGTASKDIPEDVRNSVNAMQTLDDKGKDLLGFIHQHTGSWNPQTRATAAQKIEEMKNFYNDSIKGGALTQGRLGWYDEQFAKNPTDILPQIMGSTAKLQEMVKSNSHRRDLMLKQAGFPVNASQSMEQAPQAQFQEGQTGVQKSTGRPIIYRNGAWVPR